MKHSSFYVNLELVIAVDVVVVVAFTHFELSLSLYPLDFIRDTISHVIKFFGKVSRNVINL